jgi:hypothetical protein
MSRILVVAALIASLLAFAKHERVLDRTGLLGSCSTVAAPAPPGGGSWLACRPGELTGYPDLSQDSCSRGGARGEVRYWICPTQLVGGRSSDETPTG